MPMDKNKDIIPFVAIVEDIQISTFLELCLFYHLANKLSHWTIETASITYVQTLKEWSLHLAYWDLGVYVNVYFSVQN